VGEGRFSISADALCARLSTAEAPIVVDVRRAPAFDTDVRIIAGAIRCPPDEIAAWQRERTDNRPVIVYCVHGHEVSQAAVETLRGLGADARYLAGGIGVWVERNLPTRPRPTA
jgi:thiosulfate sulfurtransferase